MQKTELKTSECGGTGMQITDEDVAEIEGGD
jgi:hypothetical protein